MATAPWRPLSRELARVCPGRAELCAGQGPTCYLLVACGGPSGAAPCGHPREAQGLRDNPLSVALSPCPLQLLPSCGAHTGSVRGAPPTQTHTAKRPQERKCVSPHWALSSPVQPRSWRRGLRAEAWGTPQGCAFVPGYPCRAPAGSGTHRGLSLRGGRPSPPRQAQRPWRPPPVATPSPHHPHVVLIAAAQTSEQPSQAVSPPGRQQHKAHARDALAFKSSIFFPFIIYIFFQK